MKYQDDASNLLADAMEYLDISQPKMNLIATLYDTTHSNNFEPTPEYYINLGRDQLCRQVMYRIGTDCGWKDYTTCINILHNLPEDANILDFGCGSAPIGFKLAELGKKIFFCDIDGASGFEFLKWRCNKHNIEFNGTDGRKLLDIIDTFDVVLAMDSIEHIKDWESIVNKLCNLLNNEGILISNIFKLADETDNVEHISLDKVAIATKLLENGLYPVSFDIWIKNPTEPLASVVKASSETALTALKDKYNAS